MRSLFTKTIALSTAVIFSVTSVSSGALEPGVSQPGPPAVIRKVSVPSELGTIQERYRGKPGKPLIVFIQDAHAIVDAQNSIQMLIRHFAEKNGIETVALEGGKGRLDPLLFRAFPDEAAKKKVLAGYLARGEVTGPEMASVFSANEGFYYGIEDWALYEENYLAYLRASENREAAMEKLSRVRQDLDSQKERVFSAALREFHDRVETFRSQTLPLLEFLRYLKGRETSWAAYPELEKLFESMDREDALETRNPEAAVRRLGERFIARHGARLPKDKTMQYHGAYQDFVTGKSTPAAFLKFLVSFAESLQISLKLSRGMKALLGHADSLSAIKGTKIFAELEALISDTQRRMTRGRAEEELISKYDDWRVLKDLASLELTHAQLERFRRSENSLRSLVGQDGGLFDDAAEFYRVALRRDRALSANLGRLLKKRRLSAAIVVAGGFHTEGFASRLKNKGYSYVLVTPRIASLAGHEAYSSVMSGKISYAANLKSTFYDAFVRHAGLRLIAEMDEPDMRKNLKFWRDQILRGLSDQKRLSKAGDYTRYVDLLIRVYADKYGGRLAEKSKEEIISEIDKALEDFSGRQFDEKWNRFQSRVRSLTGGLADLVRNSELTEENVSQLLRGVRQPRTAGLAIALANFIPALNAEVLKTAAQGRRLTPAAKAMATEFKPLALATLPQYVEALRKIAGSTSPDLAPMDQVKAMAGLIRKAAAMADAKELKTPDNSAVEISVARQIDQMAAMQKAALAAAVLKELGWDAATGRSPGFLSRVKAASLGGSATASGIGRSMGGSPGGIDNERIFMAAERSYAEVAQDRLRVDPDFDASAAYYSPLCDPVTENLRDRLIAEGIARPEDVELVSYGGWDITEHHFLRVLGEWIVDPTWQQFLVKPDPSLPKVMIVRISDLPAMLTGLGIPARWHHIWISTAGGAASLGSKAVEELGALNQAWIGVSGLAENRPSFSQDGFPLFSETKRQIDYLLSQAGAATPDWARLYLVAARMRFDWDDEMYSLKTFGNRPALGGVSLRDKMALSPEADLMTVVSAIDRALTPRIHAAADALAAMVDMNDLNGLAARLSGLTLREAFVFKATLLYGQGEFRVVQPDGTELDGILDLQDDEMSSIIADARIEVQNGEISELVVRTQPRASSLGQTAPAERARQLPGIEPWKPAVPGRFERIAAAFTRRIDHSGVSADLPVVRVDPERGLVSPQTGNVILADAALASELQRQGVDFLVGEALVRRSFLTRLQREAGVDHLAFMRRNLIHPLTAPDTEGIPGETMEKAGRKMKELFSSLLQPGNPNLAANGELINFFTPYLARALMIVPAQNLDRYLNAFNAFGMHFYVTSSGESASKILPFLAEWSAAVQEVYAATNRNLSAVKPLLTPEFFTGAHHFSMETYIYGLERLMAMWRSTGHPNNAPVFFEFGLKTVYANVQYNRARVGPQELGRDFQYVDSNLAVDYKWKTLQPLLAGTFEFAGGQRQSLEARFLLDDISLGEFKGKNTIFKHRIRSGDGEAAVLVKWIDRQKARHDLISTGVMGLIGQPAYHVELNDTGPDQPQRMLINPQLHEIMVDPVWELIEYRPSIYVTSLDPRGRDQINADELSRVLTGEPGEVGRRMRDLGAIFAVEYFLGARDAKMKHILFDTERNRFFRIDWEYMLDFESPENERIPSVLKGDEKWFLGQLIARPDGEKLIADVIGGFTEALDRARQAREGIRSLLEERLGADRAAPVYERIESRLSADSDAVLRDLGLGIDALRAASLGGVSISPVPETPVVEDAAPSGASLGGLAEKSAKLEAVLHDMSVLDITDGSVAGTIMLRLNELGAPEIRGILRSDYGRAMFVKLLKRAADPNANIAAALRMMFRVRVPLEDGQKSSLLGLLIPPLENLRDVTQGAFHQGLTVAAHTLNVAAVAERQIKLGAVPAEDAFVHMFFALTHDLGKYAGSTGQYGRTLPLIDEMLERYEANNRGIPNPEKWKIRGLIAAPASIEPAESHPNLGDIAASRVRRGMGRREERRRINALARAILAEGRHWVNVEERALELAKMLYDSTVIDVASIPWPGTPAAQYQRSGFHQTRYTDAYADALRREYKKLQASIRRLAKRERFREELRNFLVEARAWLAAVFGKGGFFSRLLSRLFDRDRRIPPALPLVYAEGDRLVQRTPGGGQTVILESPAVVPLNGKWLIGAPLARKSFQRAVAGYSGADLGGYLAENGVGVFTAVPAPDSTDPDYARAAGLAKELWEKWFDESPDLKPFLIGIALNFVKVVKQFPEPRQRQFWQRLAPRVFYHNALRRGLPLHAVVSYVSQWTESLQAVLTEGGPDAAGPLLDPEILRASAEYSPQASQRILLRMVQEWMKLEPAQRSGLFFEYAIPYLKSWMRQQILADERDWTQDNLANVDYAIGKSGNWSGGRLGQRLQAGGSASEGIAHMLQVLGAVRNSVQIADRLHSDGIFPDALELVIEMQGSGLHELHHHIIWDKILSDKYGSDVSRNIRFALKLIKKLKEMGSDADEISAVLQQFEINDFYFENSVAVASFMKAQRAAGWTGRERFVLPAQMLSREDSPGLTMVLERLTTGLTAAGIPVPGVSTMVSMVFQITTERRQGKLTFPLNKSPQELADQILDPANIPYVRDFIAAFGKHGTPAFFLFFILLDNRAELLEPMKFTFAQLAEVLTLDEYSQDFHTRSPADIARGMMSPYVRDPELVQIRYYLAKKDYAGLAALGVDESKLADRIVEALLWNHHNQIVTQANDLVMEPGYPGTRGILKGMTKVMEKVDSTHYTREMLDADTAEAYAAVQGAPIADGQIQTSFERQPYRVVTNHNHENLIVPAVFDFMLSLYRGSAEYDHLEAHYLTHSLTTALVHYANKGGEAAREGEELAAYGANAVHEIDSAFMSYEGRYRRVVDSNVALASYDASRFGPKAVPEYVRKRVIPLRGVDPSGADALPVAFKIQQILDWQRREREAKTELYGILSRIRDGNAAIDDAMAELKHVLEILHRDAGLKEAYYQAVYGTLDSKFVTDLKRLYRPGRDNSQLLRYLMRQSVKRTRVVKIPQRNGTPARLVAHPWITRRSLLDWFRPAKTLMSFLEFEQGMREGTFDDYQKPEPSAASLGGIVDRTGAEDLFDEAEEVLSLTAIHGDAFRGQKLTVDILDRLGMRPQYKTNLDGQVLWFSKPFNIGHDRIAVIAYVKSGASFVARTFYRSNSEGNWRYLPYVSITGGAIQWYHKGYHEDSIGLPWQIQYALNRIEGEEGVTTLPDEAHQDLLFAGTTRQKASVRPGESLAGGTYDRVVASTPDYVNPVSRAGYKEFGELDVPENGDFFDVPSAGPDVSKLKAVFPVHAGVAGLAIAYVFDSFDGTRQHVYFMDGKGRLFNPQIETSGPITSVGLRSNWVPGGVLTVPLYEYESQAGGYGDPTDRIGSYVSMEKFLNRVPVLKRVKAAIDMMTAAADWPEKVDQYAPAVTIERAADPFPVDFIDMPGARNGKFPRLVLQATDTNARAQVTVVIRKVSTKEGVYTLQVTGEDGTSQPVRQFNLNDAGALRLSWLGFALRFDGGRLKVIQTSEGELAPRLVSAAPGAAGKPLPAVREMKMAVPLKWMGRNFPGEGIEIVEPGRQRDVLFGNVFWVLGERDFRMTVNPDGTRVEVRRFFDRRTQQSNIALSGGIGEIMQFGNYTLTVTPEAGGGFRVHVENTAEGKALAVVSYVNPSLKARLTADNARLLYERFLGLDTGRRRPYELVREYEMLEADKEGLKYIFLALGGAVLGAILGFIMTMKFAEPGNIRSEIAWISIVLLSAALGAGLVSYVYSLIKRWGAYRDLRRNEARTLAQLRALLTAMEPRADRTAGQTLDSPELAQALEPLQHSVLETLTGDSTGENRSKFDHLKSAGYHEDLLRDLRDITRRAIEVIESRPAPRAASLGDAARIQAARELFAARNAGILASGQGEFLGELIGAGKVVDLELDQALSRANGLRVLLGQVIPEDAAAVRALLASSPKILPVLLGLSDSHLTPPLTKADRALLNRLVNLMNFTEGSALELSRGSFWNLFSRTLKIENRRLGTVRSDERAQSGRHLETPVLSAREALSGKLFEYIDQNGRPFRTTDEGITDIAIFTFVSRDGQGRIRQDSVDIIRRGIFETIENLRRFGHQQVRVNVFDDTKIADDEAMRALIAELSGAAAAAGITLRYIGTAEKRAIKADFAKKIAEQSGGKIPAGNLAAANPDSEAEGALGMLNRAFTPSAGGNRNFAKFLLSSEGRKKILYADADYLPTSLIKRTALDSPARALSPDVVERTVLLGTTPAAQFAAQTLQVPVDFIANQGLLLGRELSEAGDAVRIARQRKKGTPLFSAEEHHYAGSPVPARQVRGRINASRPPILGDEDVDAQSQQKKMMEKFGYWLDSEASRMRAEPGPYLEGMLYKKTVAAAPVTDPVVHLHAYPTNMTTTYALYLGQGNVPVTAAIPGNWRHQDAIEGIVMEVMNPENHFALNSIALTHDRGKERKLLPEVVDNEFKSAHLVRLIGVLATVIIGQNPSSDPYARLHLLGERLANLPMDHFKIKEAEVRDLILAQRSYYRTARKNEARAPSPEAAAAWKRYAESIEKTFGPDIESADISLLTLRYRDSRMEQIREAQKRIGAVFMEWSVIMKAAGVTPVGTLAASLGADDRETRLRRIMQEINGRLLALSRLPESGVRREQMTFAGQDHEYYRVQAGPETVGINARPWNNPDSPDSSGYLIQNLRFIAGHTFTGRYAPLNSLREPAARTAELLVQEVLRSMEEARAEQKRLWTRRALLGTGGLALFGAAVGAWALTRPRPPAQALKQAAPPEAAPQPRALLNEDITGLLALRLVLQRRVGPGDSLDAVERARLARSFGVRETDVQSAHSRAANNAPEVLIQDLVRTVQLNLDAVGGMPDGSGRIEALTRRVLDPYFAILEISTVMQVDFGLELDNRVAQVSAAVLGFAPGRNPVESFIGSYRQRRMDARINGELNSALMRHGFRFRFDFRSNILYASVLDVRVGREGIAQVSLFEKRGISLDEPVHGTSTLSEKYVALMRDSLKEQNSRIGDILAGRPVFVLSPRSLVEIRQDTGVDLEDLLNVQRSLYAADFDSRSPAQRFLALIQTVAAHELKHKFDEFNGFGIGQRSLDLEFSAYLSAVRYGDAPRYALDSWLIFALNTYLNARDAGTRRILGEEIRQAWAAAQRLAAGRMTNEELRQWASGRYSALARERGAAFPALERFEPVINEFNLQLRARQADVEAAGASLGQDKPLPPVAPGTEGLPSAAGVPISPRGTASSLGNLVRWMGSDTGVHLLSYAASVLISLSVFSFSLSFGVSVLGLTFLLLLSLSPALRFAEGDEKEVISHDQRRERRWELAYRLDEGLVSSRLRHVRRQLLEEGKLELLAGKLDLAPADILSIYHTGSAVYGAAGGIPNDMDFLLVAGGDHEDKIYNQIVTLAPSESMSTADGQPVRHLEIIVIGRKVLEGRFPRLVPRPEAPLVSKIADALGSFFVGRFLALNWALQGEWVYGRRLERPLPKVQLSIIRSGVTSAVEATAYLASIFYLSGLFLFLPNLKVAGAADNRWAKMIRRIKLSASFLRFIGLTWRGIPPADNIESPGSPTAASLGTRSIDGVPGESLPEMSLEGFPGEMVSQNLAAALSLGAEQNRILDEISRTVSLTAEQYGPVARKDFDDFFAANFRVDYSAASGQLTLIYRPAGQDFGGGNIGTGHSAAALSDEIRRRAFQRISIWRMTPAQVGREVQKVRNYLNRVEKTLKDVQGAVTEEMFAKAANKSVRDLHDAEIILEMANQWVGKFDSSGEQQEFHQRLGIAKELLRVRRVQAAVAGGTGASLGRDERAKFKRVVFNTTRNFSRQILHSWVILKALEENFPNAVIETDVPLVRTVKMGERVRPVDPSRDVRNEIYQGRLNADKNAEPDDTVLVVTSAGAADRPPQYPFLRITDTNIRFYRGGEMVFEKEWDMDAQSHHDFQAQSLTELGLEGLDSSEPLRLDSSRLSDEVKVRVNELKSQDPRLDPARNGGKPVIFVNLLYGQGHWRHAANGDAQDRKASWEKWLADLVRDFDGYIVLNGGPAAWRESDGFAWREINAVHDKLKENDPHDRVLPVQSHDIVSVTAMLEIARETHGIGFAEHTAVLHMMDFMRVPMLSPPLDPMWKSFFLARGGETQIVEDGGDAVQAVRDLISRNYAALPPVPSPETSPETGAAPEGASLGIEELDAILKPRLIDPAKSVFDADFIEAERRHAADRPTLAIDLDKTLRAHGGKSQLRPGMANLLKSLHERGVRLVLWTAATQESISVFTAANPEFVQLFDLIITYENYRLRSQKAVRYANMNPEIFPGVDLRRFYREFPHAKNPALLGYRALLDDDTSLDRQAEFLNGAFVPLRIEPYELVTHVPEQDLAYLNDTLRPRMEKAFRLTDPAVTESDFRMDSSLRGSAQSLGIFAAGQDLSMELPSAAVITNTLTETVRQGTDPIAVINRLVTDWTRGLGEKIRADRARMDRTRGDISARIAARIREMDPPALSRWVQSRSSRDSLRAELRPFVGLAGKRAVDALFSEIRASLLLGTETGETSGQLHYAGQLSAVTEGQLRWSENQLAQARASLITAGLDGKRRVNLGLTHAGREMAPLLGRLRQYQQLLRSLVILRKRNQPVKAADFAGLQISRSFVLMNPKLPAEAVRRAARQLKSGQDAVTFLFTEELGLDEQTSRSLMSVLAQIALVPEKLREQVIDAVLILLLGLALLKTEDERNDILSDKTGQKLSRFMEELGIGYLAEGFRPGTNNSIQLSLDGFISAVAQIQAAQEVVKAAA